jgi:hypothetical protein
MVVNGKMQTLCTVGELARALNRTTHTVRRWERSGLIPRAPLILDPATACARRRLYPLELIEALRQLVQEERFGRRRPSGRFLYQQQRLWDTWRSVMASLIAEANDGVTEGKPDESTETGAGDLLSVSS